MKRLLIKNFGPIKEANLAFGRVNIITGMQSSGKSCVLKTACYCSWVEKRLELTQKTNGFGQGSAFIDILADYYKHKDTENLVVVSPDMGGVARARNLAEQIGVPLAIIDKRRPRPNVSEVMNIIGDIEGKEVILVDDMIDTAGTITNGAQALIDRGAKCVDACCTHAVLSGPAIERIEKSPIQELVTTNTIPMGDKKCDKIKVLSVAPLIGEAILRIHLDSSVSELFE